MVKTSILWVLLAIISVNVTAQTGAPKSFGTEDGAFTVIGFDDFFPADSADGWTGVGGNSRSSPGAMLAGINMIPNGAFVTGVALYVRDVDEAEDVEAELCSLVGDRQRGGRPHGLLACSGSGRVGSIVYSCIPSRDPNSPSRLSRG